MAQYAKPLGLPLEHAKKVRLLSGSGWDRSSGAFPPRLPDSIVAATRAKYVEAYERLTGMPFAPR